MNFTGYESSGYFDETIGEDGKPRAAARPLAKDIESLPEGELELRQKAAEHALIQAGITFNFYSDSQGGEDPALRSHSADHGRHGVEADGSGGSPRRVGTMAIAPACEPSAR